jgi:hypothetical protein
LSSGLALGSLLFYTNVYWTEHGVVGRWVEIEPFPSGILIVLSMAVGILISRHYLVHSFLYWLVMAAGGWTLFASSAGTVFPPEAEFLGGCMLAIYCLSEWVTVVENMALTKSPGKAFFFGGLWSTLVQLWSVYVVAYKCKIL